MFDPWSIIVAGVVLIGVVAIAEAIVWYFQDRREDRRSVQMHFTYEDSLLQSRNHRRLPGSGGGGQLQAAPGGQLPRTVDGRRRFDRQCIEDDVGGDECDDANDGVRQIAAAVASIISASVSDENRPHSAGKTFDRDDERESTRVSQHQQAAVAAALPSVPTTPLAIKPAQPAAESASQRAAAVDATPASRSSSAFLPSTSPRLRSRAAFLDSGVASGNRDDDGPGLELDVLGVTSQEVEEHSLPPRATAIPPGVSTPMWSRNARQPASHL